MSEVHLVFGPQGAGKTTYARTLAAACGATRLSIDEWMIQLYGPDSPTPLQWAWVMERVKRCEQRIWMTAEDIAKTGLAVVLDLGFTKKASRAKFLGLCELASLPAKLHYVTAAPGLRRARVLARNTEKGETFALEITPAIFEFVELQFEPPDAVELRSTTVVRTGRDAPLPLGMFSEREIDEFKRTGRP
ncbi:MAG TPA: ATP-binding protein [Variovorax sp.]|nr:ATP-binding protein [Variovorax sp.]